MGILVAEIIIMNKEAIALAADSAATLTTEKIFSSNKIFGSRKIFPVTVIV